ncbi:hypothetical protein D3P08_18505 [Paenibacillus nanensis]|uniref:SLH domain-containing protein n=1 Tax=Paenibacillus nanensis TaxID=393251 RepID=A0A3A1URA3_9BACL|nr:Ig-like domain-containing protein [Paenibacillus nanensis]RIX51069.1 hypothetical protein D3P08_18505 [Paenibacillus nanensis]
MNRTRKLSVVLAILMILQIGLPGWSAPEAVEAAPAGPVAMSFYPADNLSNVPLGANLRIVFDEDVKRGSNTTTFTIYRSSNNEAVETINANDPKVTFTSPREAVIDPAAGFDVNTEYHVLIDGGFFLNASNNAPYAGIQSATRWNFRTTTSTTLDTTRPGLITLNPFTYDQSSFISIIKVNFNETVYASGGNIKLVSAMDTRNIAVTSSSVTGSGSTEITIKTYEPLLPGTQYTLTIEPNSFEDASGNPFNGANWSFTTNPALVKTVSFYPADNATLVPLYDTTGASTHLDLVVDFNVPVQAVTGKRIEIRKVSDNGVVHSIAATAANVSGSEVTIDTAGRLSPTTSYYVWIEPGAFSSAGNPSELFYGISGATTWNFTTGYGSNPSAPVVQTYSPAPNGTAAGTNTNLILTFNEPVYPDSGNIEIRQSVGNTLFRSIPITSARVKGGGTNQLVIDATSAITNAGAAKAFLNNTRYYVTIDSYAIRNGAGKYFAGITGTTGWTFTITQDGERPLLNTLSPANGSTAVAVDSKFYASFNKPVAVNTSNTISFIPTATGSSSYQANFYVDPTDNKRVVIEPRTSTNLPTSLDANTNYYINIEEGAITDLVGNSFAGILNQYQWTFLTRGGDTTAPTVSKSEVSGAVIRLIYNEPLNADLKPSAASYYVSVAGAPRSITSVKVEGNMVLLTLSSAVLYNQKVELSYTKPSVGLVQDISGNQAASFSKLEISNGFTSTNPVISSGSAYGNTVVLNFSEALMTPSAYAYTQFTVNVGGVNYSPTSIWHSGNVLQLTLSSAIASGQAVRVSYTPGSYPLYGTSGNTVAAINSYSLTGSGGSASDSYAPVVQSITASGAVVTIKYNELLNSSSVPGTYQYSVLANGQVRPVSNVVMAGDSVYLTLGTAISTGETATVSYIGTSTTVTDLNGNAAASFTNMSVGSGTGTGTGGQATMQGAILKGSRLTLNFNVALDPNSIPSTSSFVVRVKDMVRVVSSVQISGSTVVLTLASPANVGEAAQITYFTNTNGLKSITGQAVNNFSNVNVANQTTLLDTLTGDYEATEDGNGVVIKSSGATVSSDISPAGVSANRYTLNNDKLITAVTTSRNAGLTNPHIVFKVPDHEKAAIVAVSVITLEMAYKQGGNVTFSVQHGDATYELPLRELKFAELASAVGGNGLSNQVLIAIDQGSSSKTSSLTTALRSSKATVITGPVNYEVMVVNGNAKQELNDFEGYISRTLKTTSSVNESQSAVVWLDPVTNTLSYVPTTFTTTNGVTRATFKRKGNSAYALVKNTSSFSDMGSHWATDTVQMMARKFIVEGRTTTKYEPDKPITRGEFATYIAKGLGLSGDRAAAAKFKDVNANTAMGAYIGAAAASGIVNGVDSSSFKPNSYITRQEMATMMMRAWLAADKTVTLPSSADSYLSKYTDRGKIGSYAKTNMAQAIYLGIINGKTATTLSPTTNASRAEGAVMIMRLLEKAELLTQ